MVVLISGDSAILSTEFSKFLLTRCPTVSRWSNRHRWNSFFVHKPVFLKVFVEQISLVLMYAGIVQGFFVALLLNSRGIRRSRANIFLSVLLVSLSFSIAHILYAGKVINHFTVQVYTLGDPTFFLIAPLLWFYTQELTGEKVRFSWKLLLHFLPFLMIVLFSTILKNSVIFVIGHHQHPAVTIPFWMTVVIQFSGYMFFIQKKWARYQALMEQEVSNPEDVNISWVRFFMGVFLVVNLIFLFSLFAVIHLDSRSWLGEAVALTFSLSIFALGYKGILQKEIFQPGTRHDPAGKSIPAADENQPDQVLIKRVVAYMEERKPFLDPELTLSDLAKQLNVSRSQLSQLINAGLGNNFYDFINKYRVEEVKKLMSDTRMRNFNMLGLALEAGFKSKSTFNLIFKRFTGLTPSEYKKNISS
jgi:AraC-like DNA-binding protein